jgi:hypothetical protein
LVNFAAFAADALLRYAIGGSQYPTVITDGLLSIGVFAILGILLDFRAMNVHVGDYKLMMSVYRLGTVRVAVTFTTALVVASVGIWQQIYIVDQATEQRVQGGVQTVQYIDSVAGTSARTAGK